MTLTVSQPRSSIAADAAIFPAPPASHAPLSTPATLTSLTDILDALAVSSDPCQYLPALLGIRQSPYSYSPHAGRAYLEITTAETVAPAFRIRRMILPEQAPLRVADFEHCHGGALAELIKVPSPKIAHDLDLRADEGIPQALRGFRSAVALPMRIGATAIEWAVLLDPQADGFTRNELEDMLIRARLVSTTVDNLQIAQRLVSANLRVKHDIDEIADLQHGLLPETLPSVPGLKLAASYEAVSQAGGDIYDVFPLGARPGHAQCAGDPRWAFLIGDVSGHGPAAAVVMAMLNALVHAFPSPPVNPAEVLSHANRHLYAKRMQGSFVTALLMFYDPVTRKVTYSRAGHPPLLLTDWGTGKTDNPGITHRHFEEVGNMPLGIDGDQEFDCGEFTLEPGQTILLYTDGVTEAQNPAGKLLDIPGLELAVAAGAGSAQRMVTSILNSLEWHCRGAAISDDRTILAIEAI